MWGSGLVIIGLPYVFLVAVASYLILVLPILRWRDAAATPARTAVPAESRDAA
jgi:hypothetical protein